MFYLSDKKTREKLHSFKCVTIQDLKEYRLVDLTDTKYVGIIELYRSKIPNELKTAKTLYWKTREENPSYFKITGYWVFIHLDYDSTGAIGSMNRASWILKQMGDYFLKYEIMRRPERFMDYVAKKVEHTDVKTIMARQKSPVKPKKLSFLKRLEFILSSKDRHLRRKHEIVIKYSIWTLIFILAAGIVAGLVYLIYEHWLVILVILVLIMLLGG